MKKSIKSLISLFLTFIITISFSYAWFVSKKSSDGNGIDVVSTNENIYNAYLRRYKAIDNNDGTYSIGEDLSISSNPLPYDDFFSYDKIIYEIGADVHGTDYTISIANTTASRTSNISYDSTEDIYYNFLSNVASFSLLTQNGNSFSVTPYSDESLKKSLPYVNESQDNINEVELYEGSTNNNSFHIYLLFDYNPSNVSILFTENIGTNATSILFYEDIEFRLK